MKGGRPGLDNSNTLALGLEISGGSTSTAIATKTLGGSISVCATDGEAIPDSDSTGTFSSPSGPSIVNHVVEFHSDVVGDPSNTGGIFYCHQGVPHELVLQGDTKPGGGTFNSLEEESTSGNYGIFDDEGGSPIAIYRAAIQPGGQVD